MRIGYFGGTFDPIHEGHVQLIKAAKELLALDQVIVMPAGNPYHKHHNVSLMSYRYAMVEAALEEVEGVHLSDVEMLKRGPSYTLETVRKLRSSLQPEDELFLICGLDVVLQIHLWHQATELLQELKIAAFIRPGTDREQAELRASYLREHFQADIVIHDAIEVDISSTELRGELQAGADIDGLTEIPAAVRAFIKKHKLYQKESVYHVLKEETKQKIVSIETDLFEALSLKRLLHSLNVMYYSIELALRFDVDPDQAALAGLTHDVAREMDTDALWDLVDDAPERWRGSLAFLHAPAAAAIIPDRFGIDDPEILRAVELHTSLDAGASDLAKVIFLADKTEPSRNYSDLGPILALSEVDLDQATLACIEATQRYADRSGFPQEEMSLRAEADLRQSIENKRT